MKIWRRIDDFLTGISNAGKKKPGLGEISEYGAWAETINPLRGLTEQRARDIFDDARRGIYADIAWLYQEIEAADPTLLTCAERRESVVGASAWKINRTNPERTRGYDDMLAQEQQAYLYEAYGHADDGLGELAEHLESGFFRGFAHARPVYGAGTLEGFEFFDQWNFAFDKLSGEWWWNPDASAIYSDSFTIIPAGELVSVVRQRHIDYPALLVFIRAALGEKKYGIWLERYGIPPVSVIMPAEARREDEEAYFKAAQRLADAGRGALPHGTQVNYATEARGVNPFLEFLRHQQELTVLMATGGTLTSLSSPTGIGSGASEAHEKTWRQIVGRDIRASSRALNKTVTPRLLSMKFPGRPMLAMFAFDVEPRPTAKEVFEDAGAAREGGYLIDQSELEEASGYRLVRDDSAAGMGAMWHGADSGTLRSPGTLLQNVATPLQNSSNGFGGRDGKTLQKAPESILAELEKSLSTDLAPVAARVAALLALPEDEQAEAAQALIEDLPGLVPADPQMAAVIEEAIAEAFADEVAGDPNDAIRNDDRTADGEFAKNGTGDLTGGSNAQEERMSAKARAKAEAARLRKENEGRGVDNMKAVEGGADSPNFMRSKKLGNIAFYQGDDTEGFLHIRNNPDPGHKEMLKDNNIPRALAYGKYYEDKQAGGWVVVNAGNVVVLGKDGARGVKIITAYESTEKAAVFARRTAIENRGDDQP